MATRILLPKQGLQMTEGTIVAWLKKAGERVSRGEPLVEFETDKTTMQIEAPVDGVLLAVLCREGDSVPVATTIAFIGEPGEDVSAIREESGTGAAPPEIPSMATAPAAAPKEERQKPPSPTVAAPAVLYATPRARKTAEEQNVDLRDVPWIRNRTALSSSGMSSGQPPWHRPRMSLWPLPGILVPVSSMRRTIARRMKESLAAAAQASHQIDIDCTELTRLRADLKQWQVEITYTDILVKALGAALRQHPLMNSTWTEKGLLMRSEVNIGVAVALEDGLIVPVIRNADTSSLAAIHAQTQELISKAREGALRGVDLEGAGFTITNLGMYGIDRFTAIIDQPQSGILAVGRIVQKPVVIDAAVQIRPQMTVTLSYDHRVIDGAPAARFLQTVKQFLESPCLMM